MMPSNAAAALRLLGTVCAATAVLIASSATASEAGAERTRPGRGSAGGSSASASSSTATGHSSYGSGRPTATGHSSYGSGRPTATGKATYGYYRGGAYHPGYYPGWSVGLGYYPWYYGYGWGWPYWAGFYAYPVTRPVPVSIGSATEWPATVQTRVKPKRANVRVDGAPVGQARDYSGRWDQLYLEPGEHTIEFSAPGYMTLTRHMRFDSAGFYLLEERLAKGEGKDPRSTEAPPAPLVRENAAAPRSSVEIAPSQGSLQRGLLRLQVLPADAVVYLDGEFLARADELARLHGALPVAGGTHKVEVVRPGYVSETHRVQVGGDASVQVEIELERAE